MTAVYQRTINEPITTTGIGLHSGKKVVLTLKPADTDMGICFVRTDLGGAVVPMNPFLVQDTLMSSNLIDGQVRIGTVEHLLSAISALGLDNLLIEVSDAEMPIMDGSAMPFMQLIMQAGICEQSAYKQFLKILRPITVHDGDKWAKLSPYHDGFLMDFEIAFEHQAICSTPQTFRFELSSMGFFDEVAKARTFGFLKDLEAMRQQNLALGGSLENAIVLDDEKVVNAGGLYYPDEFVRHKMLDAVGDLYMIGYPILGYFEAYKSGHALNNQLIRAVLSDPSCYEIVTFYDKNTCPIAYYPADFCQNEPIFAKVSEQIKLYA